jgi:protein TonB
MNFTHDKQPGKNVTGITIVILLHVLVAYGIVTGLGKRMVTRMAEAVETKMIEEPAPPPPKDIPPPPPPPPPEMKAPPPPFIPPVEVNVQQPPLAQSAIAVSSASRPATNELDKAPAPATAAPATANPARVAAVADFNTCAKPEWPKASLRNEETGTVTLSFLIGVDGRVADSKILKSSGFRGLDKAAVGGISKCKFKPGLTDGKPEQAWMQMQYVWTLE